MTTQCSYVICRRSKMEITNQSIFAASGIRRGQEALGRCGTDYEQVPASRRKRSCPQEQPVWTIITTAIGRRDTSPQSAASRCLPMESASWEYRSKAGAQAHVGRSFHVGHFFGLHDGCRSSVNFVSYFFGSLRPTLSPVWFR
jgi:hypothetical protein